LVCDSTTKSSFVVSERRNETVCDVDAPVAHCREGAREDGRRE
jgi:hypothetical protein